MNFITPDKGKYFFAWPSSQTIDVSAELNVAYLLDEPVVSPWSTGGGAVKNYLQTGEIHKRPLLTQLGVAGLKTVITLSLSDQKIIR